MELLVGVPKGWFLISKAFVEADSRETSISKYFELATGSYRIIRSKTYPISLKSVHFVILVFLFAAIHLPFFFLSMTHLLVSLRQL